MAWKRAGLEPSVETPGVAPSSATAARPLVRCSCRFRRVQRPEPLFANDGGHGMIFRTFRGQLMLALHQPNKTPRERIHLFELEDTGETLRIAREFNGQP